ncbi:MAG: TPM domain-containing protein [Candidatus Aphodosoma sp.]
MIRCVTIAFALLLGLSVQAGKLSVADVPNPRMECDACWVSDEDGVLSDSALEYVNGVITQLNRQLGVQIAVVIVSGIEGDDEYDFAYRLFNHWRIGREGYNDGLLLLYAVDIRAMKFETGYALEGLLPDAYLDDLLNGRIFPLMREGKVDEAFIVAVDCIASRLTTDEAREELLLGTASPEVKAGNVLSCYLVAAFLCLIIIALLVYARSAGLKGNNRVRYESLHGVHAVTGVMAVIFPLPMLFMWLYVRRLRRTQRLRPVVCDHCGSSMSLLPEDEDDRYLTKAQQTEERIGSVDYDVWKCNVCSHITSFPYENRHSRFTVCGHCGARACSMVNDRVVLPATTLAPGRAEKTYICANCGMKHVVPYVLPVIVAVRSSGGSLGGGSLGGGGFGGGMSGGGGAGGRF